MDSAVHDCLVDCTHYPEYAKYIIIDARIQYAGKLVSLLSSVYCMFKLHPAFHHT